MLDPTQAAARDTARTRPVRVAGGQGTGKSHLARAIADDAARRGLSVLLVGDSHILDLPVPPEPARPRLHPTLLARAAAPRGPDPGATLARPATGSLRAILEPDAAAVAARLHARAAEILARFDLDADEVEAAGPDGADAATLAALQLAAADASDVARAFWPGDDAGRTLGQVADLLSGEAPVPNEGHASLVLDPDPGAVEAYVAQILADAPPSSPELEPLRKALEPWAWRSNLGTVRDAHGWASRSAALHADMASLLDRHGGFEAAASAPECSHEAGLTLTALRARFPGLPVADAVATCRKAASSHAAQASAVEPHLPRHGGRRLSTLHGGGARASGVGVGELAQRLRSARYAAMRLSTALPELSDRFPPAAWADMLARPLSELPEVTETAAGNASRREAARELRDIRDAYAATGFGDVLGAPPPRADGLRRAPRPAPEFLDMLLPPARTPLPPVRQSPVQRYREGMDPTALRGDYDVVVVDDEAGASDALVGAVDSLGTLTHWIGVRPGDGEAYTLARPHRQRDALLANVATGHVDVPAWLGSPKGAGIVVRKVPAHEVDDLAAARASMVEALSRAGYAAVGWDADAGAKPDPADLVVVSCGHLTGQTVGAAAGLASEGLVVLCRESGWTAPDLSRGPGGEAVPDGWRVVVDAAEGRILVRDGKSAILVREPAWDDPTAESVADRVERLRSLGWSPVVEWAGRPRRPADLAALLAASAVAPDPRMVKVMAGHVLRSGDGR